MSVIQKIRDKYARIAAIAIGLALLGFVLMDAFAGRTGLFSDRPTNTLGKVNGQTIDRENFDKRLKQQEDQARANGYELNDQQRQSLVQGLWDQEVTNIIMEEEYEKLGLTVTEKELNDMLYGANPPQQLRQQFSNDSGVYNANAARQRINQLLKDPVNKIEIEQFFENLKQERLMGKYMALIANTVYFPKWFLEKRNIDNSLMGKITFTTVPYISIPDSSVKVSDDEIEEYVENHKREFEQKDETRAISYVLFSAAPSAADSAATREDLARLKADFDSTKDPKNFLESNASEFPYYESYLSKAAIQHTNKDSILSAPVGVVYGPYLDAGDPSRPLFVMSKIIDVKQLPDTVKVRHILISTTQRDQQTGQVMKVREDTTAKRLVDSIQGLLNQGQNFDSLVVKYSEDPGSKDKGGVYENVTTGMMMPEFNDFIFTNPTGRIGIVKTDFGYHLIEILSQKGSSPAYKIAYLTRRLLASADTDREANNAANLFAGDSRDLNSFNTNYDKNLKSKGIPKLIATNITAMSYNINGIDGSARSFIKDIYEADEGDVLGPTRVGANYVVAVITEVNEPGIMGVTAARNYVEPIIRTKKKADQIIKNIGKVTTPEDLATKMNQVVETADSIRFVGGPRLSFESRVIGATFNPANKGKVVPEPIEGVSGIYVVRVDNTTTVPVETANIEEQRKMMEMQARQMMMGRMQQGVNPIIEVLKRSAKIKDNRAKFF